jgi:predicted dehydrogenase
MGVRRLGIVMNGVTGRMGTNQHLVRSIVAIRAEGGVRLANGDRVMPDPILVGRSEEKLAALAKAHGLARTSTNLDAALADKNDTLFFDAATTQMRPALLAKAIAAGKHVYCEKPVATNLEEALAIVRKAKAGGIRHVVEGAPYKWDLLEGAKGVQLVECALLSWKERRWVDVPELKA